MPVQRGAKRRVNRNGIRTLEDERQRVFLQFESRRARFASLRSARTHGDPRKPSGFARSRHARAARRRAVASRRANRNGIRTLEDERQRVFLRFESRETPLASLDPRKLRVYSVPPCPYSPTASAAPPCLVTREPAGQPTSGRNSNGADRSRSEAERAGGGVRKRRHHRRSALLPRN